MKAEEYFTANQMVAQRFAVEGGQVGTKVCNLFVEHVEQRSRGVPFGRAAALCVEYSRV